MPDIFQAKVLKEINKGRVIGPFLTPPIENLQCSPMGLVPKKGNKDEWRMMMDLSQPRGDSINMYISEQESKVKYKPSDNTLRLIQKEGHVAKADIDSAFWNIPMCLESLQCLSFTMNDLFYIDCCLPFRAASSCAIFKMFATFLEWIITEKTEEETSHYLDDFFFCRLIQMACQYLLDTFNETCRTQLSGITNKNRRSMQLHRVLGHGAAHTLDEDHCTRGQGH